MLSLSSAKYSVAVAILLAASHNLGAQTDNLIINVSGGFESNIILEGWPFSDPFYGAGAAATTHAGIKMDIVKTEWYHYWTLAAGAGRILGVSEYYIILRAAMVFPPIYWGLSWMKPLRDKLKWPSYGSGIHTVYYDTSDWRNALHIDIGCDIDCSVLNILLSCKYSLGEPAPSGKHSTYSLGVYLNLGALAL